MITIINIILLLLVVVLFFIVNNKLNKIGVFKDDITTIRNLIDIQDQTHTYQNSELGKIQFKLKNDYNSLNSVLEKQKEKLNRISADINNIKNRNKQNV